MTTSPAARLYGLGLAVPEHAASQDRALAFMSRLAEAEHGPGASRFLERIYRGSGIRRRHSVLSDYLADDPAAFTFYPPNWRLDPFPSTEKRMALFEDRAVGLAASAARAALARAGVAPERVTDLVVSTCTGLFAPGPDIRLVRELGLPSSTRRTLIGFMGCYAGFTGLRESARAVAADPEAVVLQVAVELCSLHFQKRADAAFQVANSLFADGAGAAVYAADGLLPGKPLAAVRGWRTRLAEDSLEHMSWRVGPTGFEMRLDRDVPARLESAAPGFAAELLAEAGLGPSDAASWAIHPGGPRILDAVGRALNLDDAALAPGRETLREYGNMSSATLFFVLDAALRAGRSGPLVAMGFGPGLTMEGAVLEAP